MSEEHFLSRWSRRKRDAEETINAPDPAPVEKASPRGSDASSESDPSGTADTSATQDEKFDLSTLPPLDSITATTDVAAFLCKGVPHELTRAALRRAWVADPVIRDFVGLAENAWDFNDPTAMPGFGPLDQTPEQVRQLVAKIVGGVRDAVGAGAPVEPPPVAESVENAEEPAASDETPAASIEANAPAEPSTLPPEARSRGDSPARNENAGLVKMVRRTHGAAVPR